MRRRKAVPLSEPGSRFWGGFQCVWYWWPWAVGCGCPPGTESRAEPTGTLHFWPGSQVQPPVGSLGGRTPGQQCHSTESSFPAGAALVTPVGTPLHVRGEGPLESRRCCSFTRPKSQSSGTSPWTTRPGLLPSSWSPLLPLPTAAPPWCLLSSFVPSALSLLSSFLPLSCRLCSHLPAGVPVL